MGKRFLIFATVLFCFYLTGCTPPTADQKVQEQQEQMQQQQVSQTGLPGITNFTEVKLVKHLYELRDQNITTYAYVQGPIGTLYHLCDSIGYGLPYGVQFSNPSKHVYNGSVSYELPQAEPNGLYMPPTAEGTWIMCSNPKAAGGIDPVYVEPRVIVSPHKLRSEGEYFLANQ